MGLTVSRKTATNLAVRRKNEVILTDSRKKKMLTVKKFNHKIRSRDLLLSPMCRKCLHNLSHVATTQHNAAGTSSPDTTS